MTEICSPFVYVGYVKDFCSEFAIVIDPVGPKQRRYENASSLVQSTCLPLALAASLSNNMSFFKFLFNCSTSSPTLSPLENALNQQIVYCLTNSLWIGFRYVYFGSVEVQIRLSLTVIVLEVVSIYLNNENFLSALIQKGRFGLAILQVQILHFFILSYIK